MATTAGGLYAAGAAGVAGAAGAGTALAGFFWPALVVAGVGAVAAPVAGLVGEAGYAASKKSLE